MKKEQEIIDQFLEQNEDLLNELFFDVLLNKVSPELFQDTLLKVIFLMLSMLVDIFHEEDKLKFLDLFIDEIRLRFDPDIEENKYLNQNESQTIN